MPANPDSDFFHDYYNEGYYRHITDEADRGARSHRWRLRWLDAMVDVRPGARIVDLGAGAGIISRHLARRGAVVEGVDLAPEAVAVARRRCEGLAVHLAIADAARCDHLPDASFDKAVSCDLIEHVEDDTMRGVLREAWRLLKPGGLFYVYSPNRDHWIERMKARNFLLKNPAGHVRVRRIAEVVAALVSCGFEIVRIARPPSMLPIVQWLEWIWMRLPICPQLAVYRISVLARKPAPGRAP